VSVGNGISIRHPQEKGLANLWSRKKIKKITKKPYASRGHESKMGNAVLIF
jgi:hypothetical protein